MLLKVIGVVSLVMAACCVAATQTEHSEPNPQNATQELVQRLARLEARLTKLENSATARSNNAGLIALPPIVVTLNEPQLRRYLRCEFFLRLEEVPDKKAVAAIDQQLTVLNDLLVKHLSNRSPASLQGREGIESVCEEVRTMLNSTLHLPSPISDVLVAEFNIQ